MGNDRALDLYSDVQCQYEDIVSKAFKSGETDIIRAGCFLLANMTILVCHTENTKGLINQGIGLLQMMLADSEYIDDWDQPEEIRASIQVQIDELEYARDNMPSGTLFTALMEHNKKQAT